MYRPLLSIAFFLFPNSDQVALFSPKEKKGLIYMIKSQTRDHHCCDEDPSKKFLFFTMN